MLVTDIAALSIERNNVVVGLSGFATNEASILLILRWRIVGWGPVEKVFFITT
jgi:hypothetical protein